ncbi:hypothetical protein GIB67_013426 [Kingdonia uniflora]|uniref:Uncharacterized protein n=1 Tax=Kingdonia uniflora TaxID=39325 RepID=A0A7J7LR02_9MAGN|nr:hypothetical protein GIB67_013426 [Kingdonia uniflora]
MRVIFTVVFITHSSQCFISPMVSFFKLGNAITSAAELSPFFKTPKTSSPICETECNPNRYRSSRNSSLPRAGNTFKFLHDQISSLLSIIDLPSQFGNSIQLGNLEPL